MSEPWPDIVARLKQVGTIGDDGFRAAASVIEKIASLILEGPLGTQLFGWTSMHDLCVQQTDVAPYSGPYLRISPQPSGEVEFRYVDTAIAARQWQRTVQPNAATARFEGFLRELRWIAVGNGTPHPLPLP